MKNLIKRIIRESIEESLFYKSYGIADMAGKLNKSNLKKKKGIGNPKEFKPQSNNEVIPSEEEIKLNEIRQQYKSLKNRINVAHNLLNNDSLLRRDNHLHIRFVDIGIKMGLIDEDYVGKLYMSTGENAKNMFKSLINEKLIELNNEMEDMINTYGENNLI